MNAAACTIKFIHWSPSANEGRAWWMISLAVNAVPPLRTGQGSVAWAIGSCGSEIRIGRNCPMNDPWTIELGFMAFTERSIT